MLPVKATNPCLFTVVLAITSIAVHLSAQNADDQSRLGVRRAVILVGLPGDEAHATKFAKTSDAWRAWLADSLQFDSQHILILQGSEGETAATKENLSRRTKEIAAQTEPGDVLWVFVLAHADEVGRQARLHLSGPDVSDMEFAECFAGVKGRQQVFWLTQTCSSQFLPPLSRKDRIVITATAPDEGQNETEFPEALAQVAGKDAMELDQDQDGSLSLAELFVAVAKETESRYTTDKRIPTEHAQLDDNGDGRGTEAGEVVFADQPGDTPLPLRRDGAMAAKVLIPWNSPQ